MVCVPKLRDSILNMKSFSEYSKRSEKSLYNLQATIVQATACFVNVLSEAVDSEKKSQVLDTRTLLRTCLDDVTLLGHANRSISNLRKKNLKSSLDQRYQALCNPSRATSKLLLGDDLDKGMREAQESNKLAKNTFSHSNDKGRYKYQPYSKSSSTQSQKSGNSFLEKGYPSTSRQKGNKHKRPSKK